MKEDEQDPRKGLTGGGGARSDKGKGRGSGDDGKSGAQVPSRSGNDSRSSSSLLGSALSGLGQEASSSLSGLMAGQGKAASGSGSKAAGSSTWMADQRQWARDGDGGRVDTTGPRQGFRAASAVPAETSSSPTSSSTSTALQQLLHDASPRYNSRETLEEGLHDIVRSQSVVPQESDAPHAALLDPAYHEAWARSLPAADLSSTLTARDDAEATSSSLVEAWNRALPPAATATSPPRIRPPTAEEPGGFMALLAAEEEKEYEEMMRPFDPQRAQADNPGFALPPPDLQAATSAGSSEAIRPYFLERDWKERAAADLAGLRERLAGQSEEGMTRRERRRLLRLVERDLAVLASRLEYTDEVWLNEAKEAPRDAVRGDDDDDDEEEHAGQAEADAEAELQARRHRALERLAGLQRHLAGRL